MLATHPADTSSAPVKCASLTPIPEREGTGSRGSFSPLLSYPILFSSTREGRPQDLLRRVTNIHKRCRASSSHGHHNVSQDDREHAIGVLKSSCSKPRENDRRTLMIMVAS